MDAYKKLWPNRQAVARIATAEELEQSIRIELDDELTHPRVRKTKEEKMALAFERIDRSELTEEEKNGLRQLYKKIAAH